MQMTLEYWNELAKQTVLISSLLSGFSITVVANLLVSDKKSKIFKAILIAAVTATASFLISVFAITTIIMKTTPGGYLKNVTTEDFLFNRIIGLSSLLIGLLALSIIISLAGWTKSKKIGVITTVISIIMLISILFSL